MLKNAETVKVSWRVDHRFNILSLLNPNIPDFLPTANSQRSRDNSGQTGSLNPMAINLVPLIDKSNIEYLHEVTSNQPHEMPPYVTELRSPIVISNTGVIPNTPTDF